MPLPVSRATSRDTSLKTGRSLYLIGPAKLGLPNGFNETPEQRRSGVSAGLDSLCNRLMSREWPTGNGGGMRIERGLVDANWGQSGHPGWQRLLDLDALDHDDDGVEDLRVLKRYTWRLDLAGQGDGRGSAPMIGSAGSIGGLLACQDVGASESPSDYRDFAYLCDGVGNVGQLVKLTPGPDVHAR